MVFESVEVRRPELTIRSQPFVELHKRLGPDPVQPPLPLRPRLDEPGLLEHAQVLRDGRLAEAKPIHEVADRPLPIPEQIEDRQPARLRQDLECGEFPHRQRLPDSYISVKVCKARRPRVTTAGPSPGRGRSRSRSRARRARPPAPPAGSPR